MSEFNKETDALISEGKAVLKVADLERKLSVAIKGLELVFRRPCWDDLCLDTEKVLQELGVPICICGQINARNCPVHQGEK